MGINLNSSTVVPEGRKQWKPEEIAKSVRRNSLRAFQF